MLPYVFKLLECLAQSFAWHGDVEALEACAPSPEDDAAVQPELRTFDNAAVQFRDAQAEFREVHPGKICSFWLDKDHMKNCLGLNKKGGHTRNIHFDSRKFKLNKAKCRYWKQIVQALAEAYDDEEIELYTENHMK